MTAALLLAAGLASAAAGGWTEVPRKVLALYLPEHVPGEVKDPFFLPMHQRAEVALNHLGLEVEHVDASRGLPDPSRLAGVRGVVVWLPADKAFADPRPVCRWLSAAMSGGVKVVLLGRVGLYSTDRPPFRLAPECAAALRLLGVEAQGARTVDPLSVSTMTYDARLVGFERRPDASEQGVVPLTRLLPGGTAYLRLRFDDGPVETAPVAVTARGGIALDPFWLYANQQTEPHAYRWVTDPFSYFELALRTRGLPKPDPTTLNGRRVMTVRVDGDGFFNLSELDRRKTSGEIFLREFVERRSSTPFTLGLIAGYYDLALYDDAATLALGRRMLARPNVEAASHGYAHPLVWRTGSLALRVPRYRMDLERELAGSARLLEGRLLGGGRRIELFQWTGDCLPTAAQLERAEDSGLLHINGGGGRFDRLHPSYAYLFPFSRAAGRARQVYAGTYNENEFTGLWTGPFYGYRDVIETFERTGTPRRVKHVDVYVHFYTAERYAAARAYGQVLDWAESRPLIPVFAARYARAVRGFFEMSVRRAGPKRYRLEGGAALRTVRFDGERGAVDMTASKGVIGYRRELGALYVFLDGSDVREVVLSGRDAPGVRLEEADFEVEGWRAAGGRLRFLRQGWRRGECVLAGLSPGRSYRVASAGRAETLKAGADGRLAVSFADAELGRAPREVTVEPL